MKLKDVKVGDRVKIKLRNGFVFEAKITKKATTSFWCYSYYFEADRMIPFAGIKEITKCNK